MCDFCDNLTSSNYSNKINWNVRSTFADDNIQEFLDDKHFGENYIETGTDYGFKLTGYSREGNTFVSVECRQEYTNDNNEQIIIWPFTEGIQFNFCPICGKQISKDIKKFEDYYEGSIYIEDLK